MLQDEKEITEKNMSEWDEAVKNLCPIEIEQALRHILDLNHNDTQSGIIRQILGDEKKPLSETQNFVFKKDIEPSLVERCGITGCKNFVPAGTDNCPCCQIEYG
jgi:hypothetical protein